MWREAAPVWGRTVLMLLVTGQLAACNAVALRGPPGTEVPVFGGASGSRAPGYSALVVRVYEDTPGNNRTHGPPIQSTVVQLNPMGMTPNDVASSTTDSLGVATFAQLAPGEYRVIVKPPAGYEAQTPSTTELSPNRTRTLTFRIRRAG
jgi:hypothetical protein